MRSEEFALQNLTALAEVLESEVRDSSTALLVSPAEAGGYEIVSLFPAEEEVIRLPAGIDFYHVITAKFTDAPRGSCLLVFTFQQSLGTLFAHIVSATHVVHGFTARLSGGSVGMFVPEHEHEMGHILEDNLNALAAGLN